MVVDKAPLPMYEGAFSGPQEFAQRVRDMVYEAALARWTMMVWCDPTFEGWPLNEKAVVDALHLWAGAGRTLILIAKSFDSMVRDQARMTAWRVRWDHIVECRVCKRLLPQDIPSVLWSPDRFVHRRDIAHSRGVAGTSALHRAALKERLDQCISQSTLGFPATVLGL